MVKKPKMALQVDKAFIYLFADIFLNYGSLTNNIES